MLEIIAIMFLCSRMGNLMRAKGKKPLFMQIMVVVVWLFSIFAGALAYSLYIANTRGIDAVENLGFFSAYPAVLLACVVGQFMLFGVAWLVPARHIANEVPASPGTH